MDANLIMWIWIVNGLLLISCGIILSWLILIRRARKNRAEKKTVFVQEVDKKVNKFLISSSENEGLRYKSVHQYQVRNLKELLYNNARKDGLIKRLLQLKSDLHGEFDELLAKLYCALNLSERSVSKVLSLSLSSKLEGADELGHFQHRKALRLVKRLLKNPFLFVRQKAQLSIIRMTTKDKNPLGFLMSHWKELTNWHQLQIHSELNRTDAKHYVKLEKLLLHGDTRVQIFALKLCIFYQKLELMSEVRVLLFSKDLDLRIWAMRAIAEMGDDTDVQSVIQILNESKNDREITECLKTLGQIGGENELFTLSLYASSQVRNHRLESVSAIHEITGDSRAFFQSRHSAELPYRLERTISHIEEPLNNVA